MKILVGVAERGAPGLLAELDRLVSLLDNQLLLAHVLDTGARGEIDLHRGHLVRRRLPHHRLRLIDEAERQAGAAALAEAVAAAEALGASTATVAAEGEPGRVLSRLAEETNCQLVAVAARVDRHDEPPGPHSVGHTARFVLDHSPRPVLLLRGRPA